MKKYQFIVNPHAKNGYGMEIWQKAKAQLERTEVPFQAFFTKYARHGIEIAETICKEANGAKTVVVAVGGDGTIHEVINGIIQYPNIVLGIIPCGSGNDFARGFCIPTEPLLALDKIINYEENQLEYIDVGKIVNAENKEVYFVNNMGAGFDAEVASSANSSSLKKVFNKISLGALVYGTILVKKLVRFQTSNADITVDGNHYSFPSTWFVTVANQPYYGGGMIIAPDANPKDGELNLTIVNNLAKMKLLAVFVSVFWGGHSRFREVTVQKGKTISISSSTPLLIHADGEIYGHTPITVQVFNKALSIIAVNQSHVKKK
jgi:diacylglycerol kinase (ATP)